MTELEARLRILVSEGRLREAGVALAAATTKNTGGLHEEVVTWQGELTQLETQHRTEEISPAAYASARKRLAFRLLQISAALAEAASELAQAGQPSQGARKPAALTAQVFMSYNHADAAAATDIRTHLEGGGISVRMDVDAMLPGASIRDFIRGAIRDTAATVCILSERSLLSGWVGQETALALASLDLWGNRPFVACYLDTRFLETDFRLSATRIIDERLAAIEGQFPDYAALRLDTNDLNAEKSRLFELRNQLGAILDRLRGSLCLDIRPDARAASLARLADMLLTTNR